MEFAHFYASQYLKLCQVWQIRKRYETQPVSIISNILGMGILIQTPKPDEG